MMTRLLDHPGRPLPKNPTHYLMVDVLHKDASMKRVSIYFNPEDGWNDTSGNFEDNTPLAVGKLMTDNLLFLDLDSFNMAYKCYLIEIETQKVITTYTLSGEVVDHD